MDRIAIPGPEGSWVIPEGQEEAAARRLAAFERAYQRLTDRQEELAGRMEALRPRGSRRPSSSGSFLGKN